MIVWPAAIGACGPSAGSGLAYCSLPNGVLVIACHCVKSIRIHILLFHFIGLDSCSFTVCVVPVLPRGGSGILEWGSMAGRVAISNGGTY